jgi:hypothetical protein
MFGGAWLLSAVPAGLTRDGYLAIPVAGPIVFAWQLGGFGRDPYSGVVTILLGLDSVVQLAGVTLAIVGAVTHRRVWNPPVTLVPIAGRDRAGAALGFRF